MFHPIRKQCHELVQQFHTISDQRKAPLMLLANYIQAKLDAAQHVSLIYICTHNSRRSHFGQIWAAVAAKYFEIPAISTFSGGTEATAFHPNAILALRAVGFDISTTSTSENPMYNVTFGENEYTTCFSKLYDHPLHPKEQFAAVMTCSDAEENCPYIPGVDLRISTNYDDPKSFDGTPLQEQKYVERSNQIALECLFVFSKLRIP